MDFFAGLGRFLHIVSKRLIAIHTRNAHLSSPSVHTSFETNRWKNAVFVWLLILVDVVLIVMVVPIFLIVRPFFLFFSGTRVFPG